jgi:hypothetical protein
LAKKIFRQKSLLDILVLPSGSISWATNHSDHRLVSWQPRHYYFSSSVSDPDPVLIGSADPDPDPGRSKLSPKKRKNELYS